MSRVTRFLEHYPLHWIALALYPTLALLAINIQEVDPRVALRPLIVSLVFGSILFLSLGLLFQDWRKGAAATSLILLLFFSYGHLYEYFQQSALLSGIAGRHRTLIPVFAVILIAGLILITLKLRRLDQITLVLNVIFLALLIFPVSQIITFNRQVSLGGQAAHDLFKTAQPLSVEDPNALPDIYVIVLDSYTRADALRDDFSFDNSSFLTELRNMGFYVADCSRSNYSYTQGSLTSTLNLDYKPALESLLVDNGIDKSEIWLLLKNSLVRSQLESIGYKTVAFETGYEWSRIADADIYLGLTNDPLILQTFDPFEAMLIRSTAGLILTDFQIMSFSDETQGIRGRLDELNFPYQGFAERQLFILDQMLDMPSLPGPKFVFVHILLPHVPYIFDAEGNIREDPGYYSAKGATAINKQYERDGYLGQVQFVNQRILEIVSNLLAETEPEPIIVLMGDHGVKKDSRLDILNTYYLPGNGKTDLYSTISPVNSFRVILNRYFGAEYPLLKDEGFLQTDFENPIPETSLDCLP